MGTYTSAILAPSFARSPSTARAMLTAASNGWIFTPARGAKVRRRGRRLPALRLLAEEDDRRRRRDHLQRGRDLRNGRWALMTSARATGNGQSIVVGTARLQGRRGRSVREQRARPLGRWYRVSHLRPLHGGGQPDGVFRSGGQRYSANDCFTITGTITSSSCNMGRRMTGRWPLKGGIGGRLSADHGARPTAADPFRDVHRRQHGCNAGTNGMFHGEAGNDGTPKLTARRPAAVVGEFNANFSNGTVAGGFGAQQVVEQVRQGRVPSMRT